VNSERKKTRSRQSLNLFRPDAADEDSEPAEDWRDQFEARYEAVITPYYDSHCHLDFLFKRSGFRGSFERYRRTCSKTFPSSFAGCVAVFCCPSMWSLSEGKIFPRLYQLCLLRITSYVVSLPSNNVQFTNFLYLTDCIQQSK